MNAGKIFYQMAADSTPVVSDWNGDGTTEIGIFLGSHTWYLDINNNGVWDGTPTDRIMDLGNAGDIPVTGGES